MDQQECVRVDSGTGVTQKLSTDFIRVVPQTSRNQFEGNLTRVRIPPAAPKQEETHSRLFLFVLHLLPLLPPEVDRQHDRGVDQRGGEDNEREVALHLVARRRETLDE